MKVYVLMTAEPDSTIESVFTTREKAEMVKASRDNPDDNFIEEFELDEYYARVSDKHRSSSWELRKA